MILCLCLRLGIGSAGEAPRQQPLLPGFREVEGEGGGGGGGGGGASSPRSRVMHGCPHCAFMAPSIGHLGRHMRTHTGERPFPCPHPGCNYRGIQRAHLKTHLLTHAAKAADSGGAAGGGGAAALKKWTCDQPGCWYASNRKEHLTRHLRRVHMKGQPATN
eukprot:SAG22_NODE_10737_length_518_cov_1.105012_1_plen_160_part_01